MLCRIEFGDLFAEPEVVLVVGDEKTTFLLNLGFGNYHLAIDAQLLSDPPPGLALLNEVPEVNAMKNSIYVIKPYRWEGMWVFDDPAVGLAREPFVGGADTMIDVATAHLPNAAQGFLAVFSASYFPDAQIVLEWVREEGGGNVYRWTDKGMEGWLCPALLRYFDQAPAKMYIQMKAVG